MSAALIPAADLEPTAAELAEARGQMARCCNAISVLSKAYAVLALTDGLAEDLAAGRVGTATYQLRRMRAVDRAARERLAELDAALSATPAEVTRVGALEDTSTPGGDSQTESAVVDVDPDSPAGKVAAELAEQLGEHLFMTGKRTGAAAFSLGRKTGDLLAGAAYSDELGHLRAIAAVMPGADAVAFYGVSGTLYLTVRFVRDGIHVAITGSFGPGGADQAAALAWLAEIGVEVSR